MKVYTRVIGNTKQITSLKTQLVFDQSFEWHLNMKNWYSNSLVDSSTMILQFSLMFIVYK